MPERLIADPNDPEGTKRFKVTLAVIFSVLIMGALVTLFGILQLGQQIKAQNKEIRTLNKQQKQERKAAATDRKALHEADDKLLGFASINQKQWEALSGANPQISVPTLVEPLPAPEERQKQPVILVIKPKQTPTPSPAPRKQKKTKSSRTPKPTASPFRVFNWPQKTR